MKKSIKILVVFVCLLAGPSFVAVAAPVSNQGAATMQHEQKAVRKTHRMSAEQITAIQEALNAHGAKLMADGKWGKETREAIREYQKENGLKPTGRANKKTRKKLGLTF